MTRVILNRILTCEPRKMTVKVSDHRVFFFFFLCVCVCVPAPLLVPSLFLFVRSIVRFPLVLFFSAQVPMTPSRLNLLERSDFIIDDNSAGGDNNTSTSS